MEPRYGWRDVNRWFADWMATFEGAVRFDELEIERGRNGLAVTALHTARGRESGAEITARNAWAYWFRKGKSSASRSTAQRRTPVPPSASNRASKPFETRLLELSARGILRADVAGERRDCAAQL